MNSFWFGLLNIYFLCFNINKCIRTMFLITSSNIFIVIHSNAVYLFNPFIGLLWAPLVA